LTPCCGLEVQKPTQTLKSVKGPGNTFYLNPKWSRTAPQAHSRVSNINFDVLILCYGGGSLYISDEKYIKDGKVLDHLGFKSKVLPGPFTDLSA
jgi:hypothetical protein